MEAKQIMMLLNGIENNVFTIQDVLWLYRAWTEGDIRLALRLLKWAQPKQVKSYENSKSLLNEDYSWQAA